MVNQEVKDLKNPTIISKLKINGKWVCQEEFPPEAVRKMVEEVMLRAGRNIGFDVIPVSGVCLDRNPVFPQKKGAPHTDRED